MEDKFKQFDIAGNKYLVGPLTLGQYEDMMALAGGISDDASKILSERLTAKMVRIALHPASEDVEPLTDRQVNDIPFDEAKEIVTHFLTSNADALPDFQSLIEVLAPASNGDRQETPAKSEGKPSETP